MRHFLRFLVATTFAIFYPGTAGAAETVWLSSLDLTGVRPKAIAGPSELPYILTPKPGPKPRLNGPKVYGCRPNHPFLYRIPATGRRPMQFAAENLPEGLTLDVKTGILSGSVVQRGEHLVKLRAVNSQGQADCDFKIVCGDLLALTPSMGWNDWYIHEDRVTDKIMREAADVIVSSGMADVGYQYVNIDGCWTNIPADTPKAQGYPDRLRVGPARDARGNLLPNKYFPDMKALTGYIHAKGLKAGIYTSPGPFDCAGFAAAYQHEAQDAKQLSDWGFDFLKYDWCSYDSVVHGERNLAALKRPYKLMGDLLKKQNRDIVFNLCQYGAGNVWEWGAEVGGHSWRTAGDLGFELHRIFEVALKNAEHRQYNRPGSWNDPDYLQIGYISDWRNGSVPRPCPLTPSEQYSFMSLWCLMAAPLIYSGDMSRLDDFTFNVLSNPEVIEVDQDPIGQCARVVPLAAETFAMIKDMEDGSKAVGLFNRGELPAEVKAKWSDLKLTGSQRVRDLWRQQDLGGCETQFSAKLSRRGGVMLRLWPK